MVFTRKERVGCFVKFPWEHKTKLIFFLMLSIIGICFKVNIFTRRVSIPVSRPFLPWWVHEKENHLDFI